MARGAPHISRIDRDHELRRTVYQLLANARRAVGYAHRAAARAGWVNDVYFTDLLIEITSLEKRVSDALAREHERPHASDCDVRSRADRCDRSGCPCCGCRPCEVCAKRTLPATMPWGKQ